MLKNINTLGIVSIYGGFSESEIAKMEKNYQNTIEISNQRDKQIGDIIFRITNDDNLRMKAIELDKSERIEVMHKLIDSLEENKISDPNELNLVWFYINKYGNYTEDSRILKFIDETIKKRSYRI